ncbi:major facilitator superfamily transporter protein [Echria macrotheca]|uniref:Major facilitator superfamily transporter protein n=1 Tax=Echria macrotheca TaxID=438768 RepID=A0AAJ0F246_9PEZI|nr:major facilitator superfamily transporter protein [Echria macrotheca]
MRLPDFLTKLRKPVDPNAPPPPLPTGPRLLLLVFLACIALLLQALDTTIVSTAIPAISSEFKTTQDVGWYGSAYFLTMCAFQIFWGRLYTFYDLKTIYIIAIVIFEVGSLLCAVAPNSSSFIVGRAIAGVGGGGVFSGSFVSIAFSVPLEKRPMFASIIGTVYGVASVLGPPIGGAFTSKATWRWCFYINLPLGAIVLGGLIPFFRSPQAAAKLRTLPRKDKLKRMDATGTIIFTGGITCLLLALQWGGQTYPWQDGRIIALLVIFGVALIVYIFWQNYLGPIATIPKKIIGQRSMAFASWYSFCQGGVNFVILYYAPLWLQAVKGRDAVESGLDIVTFIGGMTFSMLVTGYGLTKGGYSMPFMIACIAIVAIGTGLLTTWTPDISMAKVYGYLTLYGVGQGFGWQQSILIAQTMLPAADIPTGTSLASVSKLLGGAVFVSVSQTLFNNKLHDLVTERIPELDPKLLLEIGATELRARLPAELIPAVTLAYNDALKDVWWLLLALTGVSLIGALGVEWRSVTNKVAQQGGPPRPPQAPVEEKAPSSDLESNTNGASSITMSFGGSESTEKLVPSTVDGASHWAGSTMLELGLNGQAAIPRTQQPYRLMHTCGCNCGLPKPPVPYDPIYQSSS